MSDIAALDRLGADLGTALRRELPGLRRRRRVTLAASMAAALVAIPAAGAVTNWAGLAGGETALPTQVRAGLRVTLTAGRDERGPWRLDAYRAAIGGSPGAVGTCVFVSREVGGSGRCLATARLGALTIADSGFGGFTGIVGGVVRDPVARIELTLRPSGGRRVDVRAITPGTAPASTLRARGLPTDLRPFAAVLTQPQREAVGIRALDAAGRTVTVVGRSAPARPGTPAHPSPFAVSEVRP